MFEEDYIMRLIREMVRTLLKLLFQIETQSPTAQLLENDEDKETLEELLLLVKEGKINEAENSLYDLTETKDMQALKIGLLFYSYLNDLGDDFLEDHGFSRTEVKAGLHDLTVKYGLESMTELFLSDE